MMTPLDAWVLARLLSGQSVNGELADVSKPFKGVADHLNGLPLDDRQASWNGFLASRPDQESIIRAVADQDPDGPPPEIETGPSVDAWPPLSLGETPTVEPFPIDVLPIAAADLVIEGAKSIGCPPDLLGASALAVAGGAIGRSVSLLVKDGYFASASVFAAIVGPPSDGKSPAIDMMHAPSRRIEQTLSESHTEAMTRWADEAAKSGPDGKKAPPPPKPKPQRIEVDDTTMEVLPIIMSANPRGILMVRDELSAMLSGMNQYKSGGKGNDLQTLLKIWSGKPIIRDRVSNEDNVPIRCPHPSLSIVGGLVPDALSGFYDAKGSEDGFMARFLFAFPESLPIPESDGDGVPDAVSAAWHAIVDRLWCRPLNVKDGQSVPHVARFTPQGKAAWGKLRADHAREMNDPAFPPSMRGPWGKFREYAGRLALILALMEHAADPTADALAVPDVGERDVENAWRLIAYFKSHARKVYSVMSCGIEGTPTVKAIVDWLRDGQRATFSERDVKRARSWIESGELTRALSYLAKSNAVRPQEAPKTTPKGGRPSSPIYDVNPALYL